MVGAVLVKNQIIIGEGFHEGAGLAHAEVNAIQNAKASGFSPTGATLYVTLEPCTTHGRTPPCTDLIISSKIKRVVFGSTDPNPAHAGKAIKTLKSNGIEVLTGVLNKECTSLNRPFNKWIRTGTPYVLAKVAISRDGKIAGGQQRWISSERSRIEAHYMRAQVDAIIVGVNTITADNPRLTVRYLKKHGVQPRSQPMRVVIDSNRKTPSDALVLTDRYSKTRTLLADHSQFPGRNNTVSLKKVLLHLGKLNMNYVMIEGGAKVLTSAFRDNLVDEIAFFFSPNVIGDHPQSVLAQPFFNLASKLEFQHSELRDFEGDVLVHAWRN